LFAVLVSSHWKTCFVGLSDYFNCSFRFGTGLSRSDDGLTLAVFHCLSMPMDDSLISGEMGREYQINLITEKWGAHRILVELMIGSQAGA
jgi:hypothetical protein